MELQLKNIGMIKEANVKLNGLTVIAGENDTGKSTLGKALYVILNTLSSHNNITKTFPIFDNKSIIEYQFMLKIFNEELEDSSLIKIDIDDCQYFMKKYTYELKTLEKYNIAFIETPLVWSFTDFFRDIAQIESHMNIKLNYPYLMKDLNFKLHIQNASVGLDIKDKVTSLMGGEFKKDEMGRYYFEKKGQKIELVNTATGIKTFGIFQVLSQNNYLNENTVLVLDEPEVHLHPKWQLKMAELIVQLVKNGVKVLVNSHSPYMIEALQRYGEKEQINMDFYLAENGLIDKIEESNSQTLAQIFEKLSEPFDVFEEMDSQSMEKLING